MAPRKKILQAGIITKLACYSFNEVYHNNYTNNAFDLTVATSGPQGGSEEKVAICDTFRHSALVSQDRNSTA